MTCARCATPLTPRQVRVGNVCCSRACGQRWGHAAEELDAVLELLDGQRGWYLTASDLALWRWGTDDPSDLSAMRSTIHRLRQTGVRVETRRLPWACRGSSVVVGYRLAASAAEVAA